MRIIATSLLSLAISSTALANEQTLETTHFDESGNYFFSPFFANTTVKQAPLQVNKDMGLSFGFDFGYKFNEDWGYRLHAEKLSIDNDTFGQSVNGHALGLEAMYYFSPNTYAYGGVRHANLLTNETGTSLGFGHYIPIDKDWDFRVEFSGMKSLSNDLTITSINLGLNYKFGNNENYRKSQKNNMPVYENKPVTLNLDVKFSHNSSVVETYHFADMQKVVNFLNKYENTRVTVEGHTSSLGTNNYNMSLSERRANAISHLLTHTFNIDENRVIAKGFGEENLLSEGKSLADHKKNRRVVAVLEAVEKVRIN
jgi:OOP family OmpA-OmpF porin